MSLPKPPRGHMWRTYEDFAGYASVDLHRKGWRKWIFGPKPVSGMSVNYSSPVDMNVLYADASAMAWMILRHFNSGRKGRAS